MKLRLAMLGGEGLSTNIVANELRRQFGDFPVLLERKASPLRLARGRAKKLGLWTVTGQILFRVTISKWLTLRSRRRIEDIQRQYGLESRPLTTNVTRIGSVNTDECIRWLRAEDPDIVIVNGTRIIAPSVLTAVSAKFVNMHAGITPAFRGCHGAYWALANGQPQLAGTTIHWVDTGIDTGHILKQAAIPRQPEDNYATYPYLQLAVGLPLLADTIREFSAGEVMRSTISPWDPTLSRLYYHPTLWGYLRGRLRGVR